LHPLFYGIGEPLLITMTIALFAGQIQNPNILMTIFVVTMWALIWGIYIVIRHGDLVSKIVSALRLNVACN
jgi:hypothetical protein